MLSHKFSMVSHKVTLSRNVCGAVRHSVLGCEHKSGEDCPTGRNYYVCNLFFVFFLQLLGQSTLNFGEGKKSVELSPSG